MANDEASKQAELELLERLRTSMREGGRPLHPAFAPVLEGGVDPTAREFVNQHGETVTARQCSLEAALSYHTIESLFIGLTPLAMISVAYAMLQFLSGAHGELPDGITLEQLDLWGELTPFQQREGEFGTFAEECGRAGWHLDRVYSAIEEQPT